MSGEVMEDKLSEARKHLNAARLAIEEHLTLLGVNGVDRLSHPLGMIRSVVVDCFFAIRKFRMEETFRFMIACDEGKMMIDKEAMKAVRNATSKL